jgi:hypothetical protein
MYKSSQEPAKHEEAQESYSTVYCVMSKISVWLSNRPISISPLDITFTTKIEDCKQTSSKFNIMNSEVNIHETCEWMLWSVWQWLLWFGHCRCDCHCHIWDLSQIIYNKARFIENYDYKWICWDHKKIKSTTQLN